MTELTFDQCLEMAQQYLAKKERKNYYEFKIIDPPCPEYVYCKVELSDEEVEMLRQLKVKYPEDFCSHLDEIFDEDTIDDFTCGDEIVDIDLDYVLHQYRFRVHHVKPDGTVSAYDRLVELKDDEYAKLVAFHIFDQHFIINTLRYHDDNLYSRILRGVDQYYYQDNIAMEVDDPYLVTMDEAQADAEAIVKEKGLKRVGGYLAIMI